MDHIQQMGNYYSSDRIDDIGYQGFTRDEVSRATQLRTASLNKQIVDLQLGISSLRLENERLNSIIREMILLGLDGV